MDERPPVSSTKLLSQFKDWIEETELPGRTMAYLKTGMLHEVLADSDKTPQTQAMVLSWHGWESGDIGPAEVLDVLRAEGLEELLASLPDS